MRRVLTVALFFFIFLSCKPAKERLLDEINSGETRLLNDTIKVLNEVEANKVFMNYLKFADMFKEDTVSADFLFKAGDLAIGLNRPKEAISIFERLRKTFPAFRKTPSALFMEGFIYETRMDDHENAKTKYKEFIEKYPEHPLASSAQASLEQLNANLSNEELIKMFEEKNKLSQ